MMKNWLIIIVALLFSSCNSNEKKEQDAETKTENWVSIFNGKDLTGWTPKFNKYELGDNFKNTFQVKNGAIEVNYDEYETFDREFGHLFFKDKFSNCINQL